jgi:hypothetical protein
MTGQAHWMDALVTLVGGFLIAFYFWRAAHQH